MENIYLELSDRRLNHKLAELDRQMKNLKEERLLMEEAVIARIDIPLVSQSVKTEFFQLSRRRTITTDNNELFKYLTEHPEAVAKASINIPVS